MQTSGGWLSLSAGLKILDKTAAQPELPVLYGGEPESADAGRPAGICSGYAGSVGQRRVQ